NAHLLLACAAVIADESVRLLAGHPVFYCTAPVHEDRHVADSLREIRMRPARAEPAFLDELPARSDIRALAEEFLRLCDEGFPVVNVTERDTTLATGREAQVRGERRWQVDGIGGRHVDETMVGSDDEDRVAAGEARDELAKRAIQLIEVRAHLGTPDAMLVRERVELWPVRVDELALRP